jgi:hypothetical protein
MWAEAHQRHDPDSHPRVHRDLQGERADGLGPDPHVLTPARSNIEEYSDAAASTATSGPYGPHVV